MTNTPQQPQTHPNTPATNSPDPAPIRTISPVSDDSDHPREACGVFGVRDLQQPVSHLTYLGLYALQHRGQESAGIAVSDGTKILIDKDMGLVSTIFDEYRLQALPGRMAIGHTRYATTGASAWANAQPVSRSAGGIDFALGHNGNLVNTTELAAGQPATDLSSDSDVIAALLADTLTSQHDGDLITAMTTVLPRLQGAYSLVVMDETRLIGARDPYGFRPLFLGRCDTGGWVLASETPALDVVGARVIREVDPGAQGYAAESGIEYGDGDRKSVV